MRGSKTKCDGMEAMLVEYVLILKDLVRSTYENNMATEIPSDRTTETNDVRGDVR
jgi:hypothetical protein